MAPVIGAIYQYVSRGNISFYKIPHSSKLIFKRKEIDDWIEKTNKSEQIEVKSAVDKILRDI